MRPPYALIRSLDIQFTHQILLLFSSIFHSVRFHYSSRIPLSRTSFVTVQLQLYFIASDSIPLVTFPYLVLHLVFRFFCFVFCIVFFVFRICVRYPCRLSHRVLRISYVLGILVTRFPFRTTAAPGDIDACSHGRAHEYFLESILASEPTLGFQCSDYEKFEVGGNEVQNIVVYPLEMRFLCVNLGEFEGKCNLYSYSFTNAILSAITYVLKIVMVFAHIIIILWLRNIV